jgi:hypothetical protein
MYNHIYFTLCIGALKGYMNAAEVIDHEGINFHLTTSNCVNKFVMHNYTATLK